jgi:hypothetical protein
MTPLQRMAAFPDMREGRCRLPAGTKLHLSSWHGRRNLNPRDLYVPSFTHQPLNPA